MVERGVYFERDGMLQASPAPRFDGKVVAPGEVPTRGQDTAEVMAALEAGNIAGVWRS
ncbi:hypothetical protein D3C81_2058100 [compost metagenome]